MRINIYCEEIENQGFGLVTKTTELGLTFYGLRFWIDSPQSLIDHSTPEDNDLSAATIWFRSREGLDDYVGRLIEFWRARPWRPELVAKAEAARRAGGGEC